MEPRIDLNHIATFIRVVEQGSFTRAAALLNQPKSRISRQISALERDLGVQLIYRTTRHFQMTELGKEFYQKCRNQFYMIGNAVEELSSFSEDVSGLIKITAPEDVGVEILGPVLEDFSKIYPRVRYEIILTNQILNLVSESVDIAIRMGKIRDSSMKIRKIGELNFRVVASPDFIERYGSEIRIESLQNIPCFAFSPAGQKKSWKLFSAKGSENISIQPQFIANNTIFIREMAEKGLGAALLPEFICKKAIERGSLVPVLNQWRSEEGPVSILMPAQKEMVPRVKRFVEFASKKIAGMIQHT